MRPENLAMTDRPDDLSHPLGLASGAAIEQAISLSTVMEQAIEEWLDANEG